MPHFIAECSDNIREQADLPGLFAKVNERRWPPRASFRSADPQPRPLAGYLADGRRQAGRHARMRPLKIGAGRSLESRQDVGDMPFALIKSHFATLLEKHIWRCRSPWKSLTDAELQTKQRARVI
ncbi:5-carboxymethyl-2-hydroxymuconate delta-isomerase [Klebsiella pneumoniae]|nr:5-carboxymethyl-2-hydroxymuconate delta-isomerase [Klebsiella pneumoniae]